MPDGMSAENRPDTNPFASINSMGLDAAKNFPQPESKAHIPDVKMLLFDDEARQKAEQDSLTDHINRQLYHETEVCVEQMTHPETPSDYIEGLRDFEKLLEDGNIPKDNQDRWSPSRIHTAMYFKADYFAKPVEDLVRQGKLELVVDKDGKAAVDRNGVLIGHKPTKAKYAPYALSFTPYLKDQKETKNGFIQNDIDYRYDFGEPDEKTNRRLEMKNIVGRGVTELQARSILGEHISVRTSLRFRDSLEDLVAVMHSSSVTYFKGDHLKGLFNMPSVKELEIGKNHVVELTEKQLSEKTKFAQDKNIERINEGKGQLTDNEMKTLRDNFRDEIILKEIEKKHELGDQLEEAIFLNMVMLNSTNKSRMQDFLRKPGAIRLMARLADKDSTISFTKEDLEHFTSEQLEQSKVRAWQEKHIGKVDEWANDEDRILEDDAGERQKATWRIEAEDGRRKELTRWASISAWGGNPSEFSANKEIQFIEGVIGGAVGSSEAAWLAATFLRSIGAYASEGYAVLPPGENGSMKRRFLLPLGEGRYISGDDTGKFYANLFNLKEGLRGRASGLKDMIGRIPDMAMNLFDWAGVEVDGPQYPENWDGTKQRRSIWDAWLGTAEQPLKYLTNGNNVEVIERSKVVLNQDQQKDLDKLAEMFKKNGEELTMNFMEVIRVKDKDGKEKIGYKLLDLETNDRINNKRLEARMSKVKIDDKREEERQILWIKQEDGQRLGDLNFSSLEREFHGTFTIMQWLMGNGEGPTGVFVDALKTSFRAEDFDLNDLKKKIKYIGIVMNPVVLTKGSTHLYKNAAGDAGIIRDNFFDNLMSARKRSVSFAQNIWGSVIKLFGPKGEVEASVPVLIDMYIKEAKKKSGMSSAVDLVKHYVDSNGDLRNGAGFASRETIGDVVDNSSFNDSEIGKIIGKNTF